MDENVAKLIFATIMTIGFFVWLWSLQKALGLGRSRVKTDWRMIPEEPTAGDVETGSRTVRGEPEQLSQSLARMLMEHGNNPAGPAFEIIERTSRRIALRSGSKSCQTAGAYFGAYFNEATIDFERVGGDSTRISYRLAYDQLLRRTRRIALAIIFGIGLPLMAILGGVIWFAVIPSAAPAVRWQVLQTLQIVHGLWPPFLVMGVYNTGRRHSEMYFSNLLSTLDVAEREYSR
jgi:hypothetical protein